MAGKARLSQQKIDEMREYGNIGLSYKDIAKELGCDVSTVTRYLGKKHKHTIVTDEIISRMQELRDHGLSNSQIAIEIGVSPTTVTEYLGKQKVRAQYGTIVAHVTGSSFVPYEKKEIKMEQKLKVVNKSISFEGEMFSYKVCTDGRIRITSETGVAIDLDKKSLSNFISELCEVGDWFERNTEKNNQSIRLDA